jgi:hypothetical protein
MFVIECVFIETGYFSIYLHTNNEVPRTTLSFSSSTTSMFSVNFVTVSYVVQCLRVVISVPQKIVIVGTRGKEDACTQQWTDYIWSVVNRIRG